ncbi:MAG: radical SAM protein [Treponema sp.]|nr:radical SAM protein [Treponema sp.]
MHFIQAKSILSPLNGMNLYRGCTHGCIYCDSRSLCYHTPIPFEDIEVKQNAPELLEQKLAKKRQKCMIGTGAMCDPYMHCEKELKLTRRCLEILDNYGFGLAIQTKSDLIMRDIDLLESINKKAKCVVQMTLTTYDEQLCKVIEPNVCTTYRRYEVLKEMQARGIPTIVWMTPDLPFINDTEENLQGILSYCKDANVKGIIKFDFGVTLREGDREYLYDAFDKYFPGMKEKYQNTYGNAYQVPSPNRWKLMKQLKRFCAENKLLLDNECFEYMRAFPVHKNDEIKEAFSTQGEFDF